MPNGTECDGVLKLPEGPQQTRWVNNACCIREHEGERVMYVHSVAVFRWQEGDEAAERLLVAQMLELAHAKASELSEALGMGLRTVFRVREAFVDGGPEALARQKPGPKGPRLGAGREIAIRSWHSEGVANTEMASRLGVSEKTIRNALKRMGLPGGRGRRMTVQGELPSIDSGLGAAQRGGEAEMSEPAETFKLMTEGAQSTEALQSTPEATEHAAEGELAAGAQQALAAEPRQLMDEAGQQAQSPPRSLDNDPDHRDMDRLLAYRGMLNDAAPLFKDRIGVGQVGVLLAVPLIVESGVLEAARKAFDHIGPAFFGLRTSLMTLLFMALLRVKNPESLKRYNPAELGWTLGLDRAPEVKTLRRKLLRLSQKEDNTDLFLRELLERRVEARQRALGFLYVDGHVRAYSGKTKLPKTHVARLRMAMPATQELWVNDADGGPLFFVTQEAHGQLVSELPAVLRQVRDVVGADRRVTVVFDRGGWSPALFARMDAAGFDVLTYRKGRSEPVDDALFTTVEIPGSRGKEHYELADTKIEVGRKRFAMRQVTRRTTNGKGHSHQTAIVTTRRDLPAAQVAYRMFERWRQENFFKYMRQEYAIDALVEHATEAANAGRPVPNPGRKAVDKELTAARRELNRLQAGYGAAAIDNPERQRPTMRGFKVAHGAQLGIPLRAAREHVSALEAKRAALPAHVPVGEVLPEVRRLARSRKHFSDGIKMLAYQIETDLATLVSQHYKRSADEVRPLITSALQSSGDLAVKDGELRVTVAPQSSPHRTKAIAKLCAELNATKSKFPGTALRLVFATHDHDRAT